MRKYSPGDDVRVSSDVLHVDNILSTIFKDDKGRRKILDDIVGTQGTVVAASNGEEHLQVLYRRGGVKHTWKVPVEVFVDFSEQTII